MKSFIYILFPLFSSFCCCQESTEQAANVARLNNKLIKDSQNLPVNLLEDIKELLSNQQLRNLPVENDWREDLQILKETTRKDVGNVENSFARFVQTNDQRVDLVLESFSALRLLVVNQGDQLRNTLDRISLLENDRHFVGDKDGQRWTIDLTELNSSVGVLTEQVTALTIKVNGIRQDIDLVKGMLGEKTDAEQTEDTTQSYEEATPSPRSCMCSDEARLKMVTDELQNQQSHLRQLQLAVEQVDELSRELQHVDNSTSSQSRRLEDIEERMSDFSKSTSISVSVQMENIKHEMNKLRQHLNAGNVTDFTALKPGLCVWPYRRGADSCFYVHTESRLSWSAAREYCRGIQGDLAAPRHFDIFRHFLVEQKLSRSYTYWVGATDASTEGVWTWVDGGSVAMDKEVWASGQPNQGGSANCMEIRPAYKFVASDEDCNTNQYFVCEQEH